MKTDPKNKPAATTFRSMLSAGALMAVAIPAAAAPTDSPAEPKTHTLFMGSDLSVELNQALYRVQDVSGSSWVIAVKGEPVTVSAKDGPMSVKIMPTLKLTEVAASLGNLRAEPAYTPGRDPDARFARETAAAENLYIGSQVQLTDAVNQNAQELALASTFRISQANPNPVESAEVASLQKDAVDTLTAAANGPGSTTNVATGQNDPVGFDAMAITFEVSAGIPLNRPYVVIISRFHDRDAPAGSTRNLVYAQALDPIGPQARKIRLFEAGFPPGFQLKSYQLHLYNHGQEIATNVSPKRVALTRDEAFEYVKMEYVGAHKDATLPPVPAMGKLPADLPSRLAGGQFAQTLYVKVSRDGLANEAFLDEACSRRVDDPYIDSVVRDIRFKPALENGKPVEGVAPLKLSQLLM